jgi:hypothetical protein
VRILASAASAPRVFDLRCEIREKVIAFLQQEHAYALPRFRTDLPDASRRSRESGNPGANA